MKPGKTSHGRFFEDFEVGQTIGHAVPKTISHGDLAVYDSIYCDRHAMWSSDEFARKCGFSACPVPDLLVFHTVFGKTVGDLSLNAIANLGYAETRFVCPVCVGDTIRAESEVIGIKENSSGRNGIIWVRTRGYNQHDDVVLDYKRWVMLNKRDTTAPAPEVRIPTTASEVNASDLPAFHGLDFTGYDFNATGETWRLGDYAAGEQIDHVDTTTITDTEHMMATRLFHNIARVHFDATIHQDGRRLIYGGHIISLARAMSCNGLANAQLLLAINSGSHVNPCHAGDTVTASSTVVDIADHPTPGAGAIRLRTTVRKVTSAPDTDKDVLLKLDYWCLMPA